MQDHSLKSFRESRGLSQQALADLLGVAKNYIYLVESGRKPMTAGLRARLDYFAAKKSNSRSDELDATSNTDVDQSTAISNLATRLDRLEQILLDILARLPPPR